MDMIERSDEGAAISGEQDFAELMDLADDAAFDDLTDSKKRPRPIRAKSSTKASGPRVVPLRPPRQKPTEGIVAAVEELLASQEGEAIPAETADEAPLPDGAPTDAALAPTVKKPADEQ
jgi:hypothetical protein